MKKAVKKLTFMLATACLASSARAVYAEGQEAAAKPKYSAADTVASGCILGNETPEEYLKKVAAGYPSEEKRPTVRPDKDNPTPDDTVLLVVIKQEYSSPHYHMTAEHFPGIKLTSLKEYCKADNDEDLSYDDINSYRSILSLKFASNEDLEGTIALLEKRNDIWHLSYDLYITQVPDLPLAELKAVYEKNGILRAAEEGYGLIFGDGNADGSLTAADSALILQRVLDNTTKIPVENTEQGHMYYLDVNRDNALTAEDASYILSKALNGELLFKTDELNYKFKAVEAAWGAFSPEYSGKGKLIRDNKELDEFISKYISSEELKADLLNRYDTNFFLKGQLAVSLFVSNYSEAYTEFNADLDLAPDLDNSCLKLNAKTKLPQTRPDSEKYLVQITEIIGNANIAEIDWQITRYDEMTGTDEAWQATK